MNKEQFLLEIKDALQTEENINLDTELKCIKEWDSLAIMATMDLLESEFNVETSMEDYVKMKTVGDIAKKAGLKIT